MATERVVPVLLYIAMGISDLDIYSVYFFYKYLDYNSEFPEKNNQEKFGVL